MDIIDVKVKGYCIYCENDVGEIYDFFVPKQDYRMYKTEAREHVPETHKLIDIKRDFKFYRVPYDKLKEITI